MDRRFVLRWLLALLVLVLVASAGVYVYNIGLAHGQAQAAFTAGQEAGAVPYPPYGYWPYFRPFGFGFGLFGLFFLLFLVFGLSRLVFWGMLRGAGRRFYGGGPDMLSHFEEWHRKQHESQPPQA